MDQQVLSRPRIGVPWRTAAEEAANQRAKIDKYMLAVERAGGEPILLSLIDDSDNLKRKAYDLDRLPNEQEVLAIAEKWRPFRSLATSYLFASAFDPGETEATAGPEATSVETPNHE